MAFSATPRPPRESDSPDFGVSDALVARVARALLVLLIPALCAYLAAIAWELNSGASGADALHIDFVAFWAAARLAVAGEAISAFDTQALVAAQALGPDVEWDIYGWHYPPSFHLLVAPLRLLGFTPAFVIFSAAAFSLYLWALRGWARPVPGGLGLAAAAPPVVFVLITGNSTLLWAAAFLAGLACVSRRRPRSAGALIALLTLKPQLGLLVPVALIAGRQWRTLAWSALAATAIVALTLAIFGPAYWDPFFAAMARTTETYRVYGQNAVTMVTWYAFARQFGAGHEAAILFQLVATAGAAITVGLLWARSAVKPDMQLAGLCLATLVATPYAYQYELVLAVLAALFLARAGTGNSLPGRLWLAALWLLPVPGWLVDGLEIAHYCAPALTGALSLCLLRALRGAPAFRAPAASP